MTLQDLLNSLQLFLLIFNQAGERHVRLGRMKLL